MRKTNDISLGEGQNTDDLIIETSIFPRILYFKEEALLFTIYKRRNRYEKTEQIAYVVPGRIVFLEPRSFNPKLFF